jgi:hypothetical protein
MTYDVEKVPYLRLRRSHISAAIEPITPIATSPDVASISGTATAPAAYALTVDATTIPKQSQILIVAPFVAGMLTCGFEPHKSAATRVFF